MMIVYEHIAYDEIAHEIVYGEIFIMKLGVSVWWNLHNEIGCECMVTLYVMR